MFIVILVFHLYDSHMMIVVLFFHLQRLAVHRPSFYCLFFLLALQRLIVVLFFASSQAVQVDCSLTMACGDHCFVLFLLAAMNTSQIFPFM